MPSKVYFTKEITPESLIKVYEALGLELKGKVGIKVSTGEAGAKGYLKAELIAPLVEKLNGTIIECNTAYPGKRTTTKEHQDVAKAHGFTEFAEVDIMDADGGFKIPVKNGKHLEFDLIGNHFAEYDSILNLAHGKGHAMGGFGANLKINPSVLHRAKAKPTFILVAKPPVPNSVGRPNMNKLILSNPWPKPLLP